MAIEIQDSNVPEGGVELDENGQEVQQTEAQKQQALIEKGRAIRQNDDDSVAPTYQKPEGIPDKFWDAKTGKVNYEAMAKSYTELESKLGGNKQETTDQTQDTTQQQETQQASETIFTKAAKEFAEKGAVTEETYKQLAEKHGIPKEFVDSFVEGQVARQQLQQQSSAQQEAQLLGTVGGREVFNTMAQWAAQSFTEAELKAFNQQVSLSAESAALALQLLKTRYEQANGKDAKLITAGRPPVQGSDGFASKSEMMAAMRDPRYKSDAAFQAEVARKMANRRFTN